MKSIEEIYEKIIHYALTPKDTLISRNNMLYPHIIVEKETLKEFLNYAVDIAQMSNINQTIMITDEWGEEKNIREIINIINQIWLKREEIRISNKEIGTIETLKLSEPINKKQVENSISSDLVLIVINNENYAKSIPFRKLINLLLLMMIPIAVIYESYEVFKSYEKYKTLEAPVIIVDKEYKQTGENKEYTIKLLKRQKKIIEDLIIRDRINSIYTNIM